MNIYISTSDDNKKPSINNHEYASFKGNSLSSLSQYVYLYTCSPTIYITVTSTQASQVTKFQIYATKDHMQVTYSPISALG